MYIFEEQIKQMKRMYQVVRQLGVQPSEQNRRKSSLCRISKHTLFQILLAIFPTGRGVKSTWWCLGFFENTTPQFALHVYNF